MLCGSLISTQPAFCNLLLRRRRRRFSLNHTLSIIHHSHHFSLSPPPLGASPSLLLTEKVASPPRNRNLPKKEDKKSPKKSKDGGGLRSVVEAAPVDMFSGSAVFTAVSPPPSSLPLPTFSLRPKLGCKAEAAAGVDAGATNDLRRLLRLR